MELLTRSQLAQRVGVNLETIRFYEKEGLISASRTPSGYRRFSDAYIERLEFVKGAKLLGFSLAEVRDFSFFKTRTATIALQSGID